MEVTGKGTADDHYVVKCTNLNHAALRYYTSRDLAYSSNDSETNRLYKVFEIYHENTPASGISGRNFVTHNEAISKVGSVVAGYCPEGYRVPNQLELAVMKFLSVLRVVMMLATRHSHVPIGILELLRRV